VTFNPAATGNRDGTLTITDNDHGVPGSTQNVDLRGNGTDFALGAQSGGSTSDTVNAGQTGTFALQLAPTGFTGSVSLACTENITAGTCSVVPTSVTLDGTNPANLTVNATTTARSMLVPFVTHRAPLLGPEQSRRPGGLSYILLALTALVILAGNIRRPKGLRQWLARRPTAWGLSAAMLAALLWASCGGGGTTPPPPPPTGTPAGDYTVTLTATSGGLTHSIALSLKVN